MKRLMCALAVSSLAGLAAITATPSPAHAQVGISLNFGNVAFGYRDGYYDRYHRWHRWQHDADWRYWQHHNPNRYRDFNHDRYGGRRPWR